MSRAEVDQAIGEFGISYDRISTAMYALETQPDLAILRDGTLTGETARYAADMSARTGALWSQYAALGGVLERVRTVRARRSRPGDTELEELTGLLRDPVVALDADAMVLDPGAEGPPTERLPVAKLVGRVEAGLAEVTGSLAELGASRDRLAGLLDPLDEALRRVRADAEALGDHALPAGDLDRVGRQVEEVYRAAFADPLGTAADSPPAAAGASSGRSGTVLTQARVRELAAEVSALAVRLAGLAQVRDGCSGRLARLGAELDELATAEAETARVHALALVKIADPALPATSSAVAALRAHLAQLDQLRRERRWPRLGEELVAVERAVGAARRRTADLHEAADGLLRRRGELRGRLDAYRAKAGRFGLIEHPELSARHGTARELLYTSPCDLPAATRAVVAYQRCLNDLTERSAPGRREPSP